MKEATRDDVLLHSLVDSDNEDEHHQQRDDNEHQNKVLSYWKKNNIKQAVDLVVECWNNVMQKTIHHAWRKILAALPENRVEIQSAEEVVEAAAAEARLVPGGGFDNTNVDDIMEMIRPPHPTAAEILEEEEMAEEEGEGEEEGGGERRPGALSINNIKELIELGHRMQHFLEQDGTINSEARCALFLKVLEGYHDQYNAHVNNLHQGLITNLVHRRNETQEPQPGPSHATTTDSQNEDNYFEGFGSVPNCS
ncbi:hypothetical protein Pmani_000661 [Petrolisthes manimaculis]|uniref:Uncharacterized protein n=1 Tax=Petrolisthes manimaculis TaxID=1843537 RepID=A0AAE1QPF5_9EUCA|nr:hypothetical protein Pmani_000661 [Petrolisthes manimaculis]